MYNRVQYIHCFEFGFIMEHVYEICFCISVAFVLRFCKLPTISTDFGFTELNCYTALKLSKLIYFIADDLKKAQHQVDILEDI